ncbi:unknown [[Mannheimia] succiniciproducens MBEL55E]|uniref:Uncharacterized protein n=1 Tax=Mannheimia succiniciproducens (strain KCTC 0769BP / MBEL55E) TaxID=221988 RepID=Q65W47_MANSM|nr:unknown [[Mannheimia] succiniciproducens MBEL55E]
MKIHRTFSKIRTLTMSEGTCSYFCVAHYAYVLNITGEPISALSPA